MEVFWLILGLFLIVAWITALIEQFKKRKATWFVFTLLFPVVGLVYWIVQWLS